MLLRPKTQLQDITVEVDPGTPAAGRLKSGATIPISQTSPNVNLDEFLSSLDADTRNYVQLLLAGAAQGLHGNSRNLAAAFKRFSPFARDIAGTLARAGHAPCVHRALAAQFQAADRSARLEGQGAGGAGRFVQCGRSARSPSRIARCRHAARASRGAAPDQAGPRQARRAASVAGPTLENAPPVRGGPRPGAEADAAVPA